MESKFAEQAKHIWSLMPYLAFLTALFFTERELFGVSDALLGIVFLFFARDMVKTPGLHPIHVIKNSFSYFVMSVWASLCGLGSISLVLGSAVFVFAIALLDSDDYVPRHFFSLGLGYLFLLVFPIGWEQFPLRIEGTLFGIGCTLVFIFAMRAYQRLDIVRDDRRYVQRALDELGFQLVYLVEGNAPAIDSRRVYSIAKDYAREEYACVFDQGGLLSGRQRYTFLLLVCCEQLSGMIAREADKLVKSGGGMSAEMRSFALDLSEVFLGFGSGNRTSDVRSLIDAISEFLYSHQLQDVDEDTAWRSALEAFRRVIDQFGMSRDTHTPIVAALRYRLRYFWDNLSLSNSQVRFALQLASAVGLSFVAAEALRIGVGMEFTVWIPITAYAMLHSYRDETVRMAGQQIAGTLVGLVVFVAILHFLPEFARLPVALIMGYAIILLDIAPWVNMAAGTQMALVALYPSTTLGDTLVTRLAFVLMAAMAVMFVAYTLLNARRSLSIEHKIKEMARVDGRLLERLRHDIAKRKAFSARSTQLLYYLHMNAAQLEQLAECVDERMRDQVEDLLDANYRFAMDAAHAVVFLLSFARASRFEHLDGITEKLARQIADLPDDVHERPAR